MPNVDVPQPVSSYVIGDTWAVQWTVTVAGTATDAATFTVRVERPNATYYDLTYGTDAAIQKTATGTYVVLVSMTQVSTRQRRWTMRMIATVATTAGTITRAVERCADCVASREATPN